MLLQALASYADSYLSKELNDTAFEQKPVLFMLELSTSGRFLQAIRRETVVTRGKKQVQTPRLLRVPRSPVNRNSGHYPLLGADDIAYLLGVGPWTSSKPQDRVKTEKHHQAFIHLIQIAAEQTGDQALSACASFYNDPAEVQKARSALAEAEPGTIVALSVDGSVTDRSAVQAWWRSHYQTAFSRRLQDTVGECLLTGVVGPVAPTHEKIKGVSSLGGQASGVALMSFDKDAFQSYGWVQNQNSPLSPDRAMAYVLALNALLRSGDGASSERGRRIDLGGIGFLAWLRKPDAFNAFHLMQDPDPEEVKELLRFKSATVMDPNQFYMLGVSANGARLRVRYWVTDSLDQIRLNLQQWHTQLRVFCPGQDARPVAVWQLLHALHREGKPPAHQVLALLRRGIEGRGKPLGYEILSAALARLRHPPEARPEGQTRVRTDWLSLARLRVPAGLLRMCLNDIRISQGGTEMSEGLDPQCAEPAYVCGRMMAEFENLQRQANRGSQRSDEGAAKEINSSVLDRYFSLASTYPKVALPRMERLAQTHLRKLRRDRPGAAVAIDRRLQDLHRLLSPKSGFPANLSLDKQGLFMLGYYHQKAWSIAQAVDRADAAAAPNEVSDNFADVQEEI